MRLRKANFDFEEGKEKGVNVVKDMPLLKYWEKTGEWAEEPDADEYQDITSLTIRGLFNWNKKKRKYLGSVGKWPRRMRSGMISLFSWMNL